MAFSERARIVSSEWVTVSVLEQTVHSEEEYTVRGIVLGNKLIKFKDPASNDQILRGFRFWVEEKDNDAITYRKVIRLIENCGGTISDPAKGVILVSMTERPIEDYDHLTVTYRYVLDSLSFQTALKMESYRLE